VTTSTSSGVGSEASACSDASSAAVPASAVAAAAATSDRGAHVVRRELPALRKLRLALLPDREQRRGDEDRRVRTGGDADDEREGEVLERGAAEDLERDDPGAA